MLSAIWMQMLTGGNATKNKISYVSNYIKIDICKKYHTIHVIEKIGWKSTLWKYAQKLSPTNAPTTWWNRSGVSKYFLAWPWKIVPNSCNPNILWAYNFVENTLYWNINLKVPMTVTNFLHKIVWNRAYTTVNNCIYCLMRIENFKCKFKLFCNPEWKVSWPHFGSWPTICRSLE